MTQDKQLLIADLCARLPFGVKVWYKYGLWFSERFATAIRLADEKIALSHKFNKEGNWYLIEEAGEILIKPYLRPMSSMTEDEAKEIAILHDIKDILSVKVTSDYIDFIVDDGVCSTERRTIWYDEIVMSIKCFDWLNSNHFDYRGLIPKGLALIAPEGMYKVDEQQ